LAVGVKLNPQLTLAPALTDWSLSGHVPVV